MPEGHSRVKACTECQQQKVSNVPDSLTARQLMLGPWIVATLRCLQRLLSIMFEMQEDGP